MFDLLEKAGIVRRVDGQAAEAAPPEAGHAEAAPAVPESAALPDALPGLSLDQIYDASGVPPTPYPAERLLRLIDGLKAMDEPTRLVTIRALDAADDSWSIDDPMRDAATKIAAIEQHGASIRATVARAEQDTRARREQLAGEQAKVQADIRRQIADLEGLLSREVARSAQENAALDADLARQRDAANLELTVLSKASAGLKTLIDQFGGAKP